MQIIITIDDKARDTYPDLAWIAQVEIQDKNKVVPTTTFEGALGTTPYEAVRNLLVNQVKWMKLEQLDAEQMFNDHLQVQPTPTDPSKET